MNFFWLIDFILFIFRSGIVDEEDRIGMSQFQNQMLISQAPNASLVDVKQESSGNSYAYGHGNEELNSCVTSFNSNNMLDFSNNNIEVRHPPPDRSSEVSKRIDFILINYNYAKK
jgi:hypothetical protein